MKYLIWVLLAFASCSCATVIRGTSDTARFESTPPGADVTAESISEDKMGPYNCITPCELELKRKRTWQVDFELEGYKPVSGLLKPKVTGGGVAAGAGNAILGGIVGIGIDAGTGANLDLMPNPMIAEFQSIDSPDASSILDAELVTENAAVEETLEIEEVTGEEVLEESPLNAEETDIIAPTPPEAIEDGISIEEEVDAVSEASPSRSEVINVRLYKPGERAPNDEESDDLNQGQLDKIKSFGLED